MNEGALVQRQERSVAEFSNEDIQLIKETVCKGATDGEFRLFINQCKATGLNPLAKQIHAVKRWNSSAGKEVMAIQVAIDGLRLIAERTGNYAGQVGPQWCGKDGVWCDAWLVDDEPPAAARVGVWRNNFKEPCWGVARYKSYMQTKKGGAPNHMWSTMPDVMLAKCAEALALRKAFPQELSGLYSDDEMGQADNGAPAKNSNATDAQYSEVRDDKSNGSPINPQIAVPPHDPSTGEFGPHTIAIPADEKGWTAWVQAYGAGLRSAKNIKVFEAWVTANAKATGDLYKASVKLHTRLLALIADLRSDLQKLPEPVAHHEPEETEPSEPQTDQAGVVTSLLNAKEQQAAAE